MTDTKRYDETELFQRMASGDEAAYTDIYNHYWDKLFFIAHKHLHSAVAAEEVVQEVFLTLWKKRAELTIHSLPVYLAAMTRYAVYRNLAQQKKYFFTEMADADKSPVADAEAGAMDNKLLLEMVERLSSRLPEKCRMVFVRNKLLDQPLDQVAEDMNISTKTAEAHLTKALKIIRNNLGDTLSLLLL